MTSREIGRGVTADVDAGGYRARSVGPNGWPLKYQIIAPATLPRVALHARTSVFDRAMCDRPYLRCLSSSIPACSAAHVCQM